MNTLNSAIYHLDYTHNPDIYAVKNILLFRSNFIPNVGDKISINNSAPVEIDSVEAITGNYKHNIKVEVSGNGIQEIREMLTYRLDDNGN